MRSLPVPLPVSMLGATRPFFAQRFRVEYGTPVKCVTCRGVNPTFISRSVPRLTWSEPRYILSEVDSECISFQNAQILRAADAFPHPAQKAGRPGGMESELLKNVGWAILDWAKQHLTLSSLL